MSSTTVHFVGVTKPMDLGSRGPLPEFDRPPVVETAIGVVMLPVEGWKLTHFTRFGRHVEARYPTTEPQDRIITTAIEEFGAPPRPSALVLEAGASSLWWYVDDEHGRLIQLQRDRFVHNWRKNRPDSGYPRYEQTREQFRATWLDFIAFLDQEGLPGPTVLQVEIDYVNHIVRGSGWDTAAEIAQVTPLLNASGRAFLSAPEAMLLNARYLMPNSGGRLHVTLQPAIRNSDKVELLQLTLSARGRPLGSDLDSIMTWCDLGHEWIVRGFVDVTTERMHKLWGRTK